ncbi:crossover junction endodeoxyribonuclease RuvC [bacterium]|nr:crossover junction endodeoxyribonuclease RuvC [bacterium]
MKILGVDPGSRLTGYGCVEVVGPKMTALAHGTLKLASTSGKQETPLEKRLLDLFTELNEVIDRLKPDVLAVERVFFAKNAVSSLKLGQARGVVIVCGALKGLQIVEYSPTEVKRAVVGSGTADKVQVARVLEMILGRQEFATADSSDALALAVCHGQQFLGRSGAARAQLEKSAGKSARKGRGLAAMLGLTPEVVGNRRRVDFSKKS